MNHNNLIDLKKPEPFVDDTITDIIRQRTPKLVAPALETEIELFIGRCAESWDELLRQRIAGNGRLPRRDIRHGVGADEIRTPRIRNRHAN
jgi:hypothetical protein